MLEKWFESLFIKRTALAIAAGVVAQWAAHQIPTVDRLAAWGIHITMNIDQETLADHLTVLLVGLSQGAHEVLAGKYPSLSKWI